MNLKENKQLENLWHHAPAELPSVEDNPDYEDQIRCLVKHNGFYEVLYYNVYYKCWDNSDGDDFLYNNDIELDYIQLEN